MTRPWTSDQQHAIYARGGGILVSAAAGSGKTAVLVERVIQRITDRTNPVSADRFLVVTFTKAAAAEMEERIASRLRELLREHPDDRFLERQLILLQKSKICTIDSFFYTLVREHAELLGISPKLRIVDEAQLSKLFSETLSAILEEEYARADPDFAALVRYFGEDNDRQLTAEIGRIYHKIRSLPFPQQWLEEAAAAYWDDTLLSETVWGKELRAGAEEALLSAKERMETALTLLAGEPVLEHCYRPAYQNDLDLIEAALSALQTGSWDEAAQAVQKITFIRASNAPRGYPDLAFKERVSGCRELAKKEAAAAKAQLFCREQDYRSDLGRLAPLAGRLFSLVRQFYERLDLRKAEQNIADFSDFAYLALRLVCNEDGCPTKEGRRISEQYEEILLDEYQDTNRLQDLVFRSISRNGENLFFVGDLKQSIYRFRNADPAVFTEKKDAFSPFDGEHYPAAIALSMNFRSRFGITSFVNDLFSRLMSREIGGVDYTEPEWLNCGAIYPESDRVAATLQMIDCKLCPEEEAPLLIEARATAQRIAGMLACGAPVTEHGETRPCRSGDFVILLRSQKDTDWIYAEALQEQGIRAVTGAAQGYFTAREVSLALSLLRLIDNPADDLSMTAVLLSPLFSFSCDDVVRLHLRQEEQPSDRPGSLYAMLLLCEKENPKAAAFLQEFRDLREKAAQMKIQRLIQYLYDSTDLIEVLSGTIPEREANLKLLLKYAGDYEQGGSWELSGFIRYIDRLIELGRDFEVANPMTESQDAVRIMTIHRSKGLEFPIVILAGCRKRHNIQDMTRPTVLDTALGYGMKVVDREQLQSYETAPYRAIRRREQQNLLSEELRLLYVALTRAKEYLILNLTETDLGRKLQQVQNLLPEDGSITPYVAAKATSYADWIWMALLRHPAMTETLQRYGLPVFPEEGRAPLQVTLEIPSFQKAEKTEKEATLLHDPILEQQLLRQLEYRYPYEDETQTPAKLSVTELSHSFRTFSPEPPQFISEKGYTPAQKGTIFHRALQFADFAAGRQDAAAELLRLTQKGYLTMEESASVDVEQFAWFFQSELVERILRADRVWREYRFFSQIPAREAGYGSGDILIQGIADCMIEEDGCGILIDFKTDQVSDASQLIGRYRRQLLLYQRALSGLFPRGIRECVLYAAAIGKSAVLFIEGQETPPPVDGFVR